MSGASGGADPGMGGGSEEQRQRGIWILVAAALAFAVLVLPQVVEGDDKTSFAGGVLPSSGASRPPTSPGGLPSGVPTGVPSASLPGYGSGGSGAHPLRDGRHHQTKRMTDARPHGHRLPARLGPLPRTHVLSPPPPKVPIIPTGGRADQSREGQDLRWPIRRGFCSRPSRPCQARFTRWAATSAFLGLRTSSHHWPVRATMPTRAWA